MLSLTSIFSRSKLVRSLRAVRENPSFVRVAGSGRDLISDIDLTHSATNRLGVSRDDDLLKNALNRDDPIRFAITPCQPSMIAILTYMQRVKGYHLEIDYRYAHTSEIVGALTGEHERTQPDVAAISIGSLALLYSSGRSVPYKPFMFQPSASQNVVSPAC